MTFDTTFDRTDQQVSVTTNGGGSSTVYNYDPYGNLISNAESVSSVTAMTYDLADKLTAIDAAGTANDAAFTFDAVGRFRTRVLGGGTSTDTYSYAGTSETVLRIANSSGPTVTDSLVSPAGDRLGIKQGSTVNWLLPDLHGNVGANLSADEATVVNATRYDAYGQTLSTGTAGGIPVGQANWKYQGRLDVSPAGLATPLYDMSARFYSPGLGAFTQFDSLMGSAQNPLSMNRFLYALANPATFIDPTGHLACSAYNDDCRYQQAAIKRIDKANHMKQRAAKAAKSHAAEHRYTSRRQAFSKSPRLDTPDSSRRGARTADLRFSRNGSIAPSSGDWGWDPFGPVKWAAGMSFGIAGNAIDLTVAASRLTSPGALGQAVIGGAAFRATVVTDVGGSVLDGSAIGDLERGWNHWWADKSAKTHTGDAFRDGLGASEVVRDVATIGGYAAGAQGLINGGIRALASRGATGAEVTSGNLYINGGMTENNLTPRLRDVDGLSSFDTIVAGIRAGRKGVCIDASCLAAGGLKGIRTGRPGHVSIRPIDSQALNEWLASRANGTFRESPFTKYLVSIAEEVWNRP